MTNENRRAHWGGIYKKTMKLMRRKWILYLFLLPALLYIGIFNYGPMYGLQIAFKDYSLRKGIIESEWIGLEWFVKFFSTPRFWTLLKNTLRLSFYSLIAGFPFPIILALFMNNINGPKRKKFVQTITYMPHFISTVVIVGMISVFFSPRSGFINTLLSYVGFSGETYFLGKAEYFPHLYVWTGIWQSMGWGSIIYMAALSGVDPSLHESAMIDGANKFQRIIYIDLPTIIPTIVIMLIMNSGSILKVGYEKVYLMKNSLNSATADIISTYVYEFGLLQREYSYSTAIGLFNNTVSLLLLVIVNKISAKLSGSSLW